MPQKSQIKKGATKTTYNHLFITPFSKSCGILAQILHLNIGGKNTKFRNYDLGIIYTHGNMNRGNANAIQKEAHFTIYSLHFKNSFLINY
jgi:hypothetical protein